MKSFKLFGFIILGLTMAYLFAWTKTNSNVIEETIVREFDTSLNDDFVDLIPQKKLIFFQSSNLTSINNLYQLDDGRYLLHDNDIICFYTSDGILLKSLSPSKIVGRQINLKSNVSYLEKSNEIIIADGAGQKVYFLDEDANLNRTINLHFTFSTLRFNAKLNRFVVFAPGVKIGNNILQILDENLEPIYADFKQTQATQFCPVNNQCLKTIDGEIYFQEPLSRNIWKISWDGSKTLAFRTPLYTEDYQNKLSSYLKDENIPKQKRLIDFTQFLPIEDFNMDDNFVYINTYHNSRNRMLIYNRQTNEAVQLIRSIKLNDFGKKFNFFYPSVHYSYNNKTIHLLTSKSYSSMLSYFSENEIESGLDMNFDENKYSYVGVEYQLDFDELYKRSFVRAEPSYSESLEHFNYSIYPNPNNREFKVSMDSSNSNIEYFITTKEGRLIEKGLFNKNELPGEFDFNLSNFKGDLTHLNFSILMNNQLNTKQIILQ